MSDNTMVSTSTNENENGTCRPTGRTLKEEALSPVVGGLKELEQALCRVGDRLDILGDRLAPAIVEPSTNLSESSANLIISQEPDRPPSSQLANEINRLLRKCRVIDDKMADLLTGLEL